MNDATLAVAIAEAERFLKRAKPLQRAIETDRAAVAKHNAVPHAPGDRRYPADFGVQNGAVKRASMDLTRALAALRRPA